MMANIRKRVVSEGKQAVRAFSEQVHASVVFEMESGIHAIKDSPRDRPGDVPADVRPHLKKHLSDTEAMVAQPRVQKDMIIGGWGNVSYMDSLVPMWVAHTQTREDGTTLEKLEPPRVNADKPLWRIVQDGRGVRYAVAKYPSFTGRTDWLMWVETKGGKRVRRFYPSFIRPLRIGPMKPKPFIRLGIYNTSANVGGSGRMLNPASYFAQYVAEHVLIGNFKVVGDASFIPRRV